MPTGTVCPEAGTATGIMTVLMAVMRGTVLHELLAPAKQISLAVPTITASLSHGCVTLIMTVETDQMRPTVVYDIFVIERGFIYKVKS